MEKWKIAVIVALLAALPAYSYFADPSTRTPPTDPTNPDGPSEDDGHAHAKSASQPPPHMQRWWYKKPPTFSFPANLWANTSKPIKLEELRGKVVLLELWRANCSHCQEAAPIIEGYAEKYKAQGLQVVGVHSSAEQGTIEYDWGAIKKKMAQMGVKYPVAFDEQRSVFNLFKAEKFPTFFIIDRQGIIRYAHEGMTKPLQKELEAALKQVMAGKRVSWPPTKSEPADSKSEPAEDAAVKFAPGKTTS